MRGNLERELKLVPGEGFELPPLGLELPAKRFTSTYFDTPDLRLAPRGVTFRHRLEDGTGLWQLKIPHGASRIELEVPGPPARPPAELLDLLVAHVRGRELVRVARLRTRRQRRLADGAEIVDDSVAVLDGQRVKSRFRELEIELVDGDEASLERLEKALLDAGAWRGEFRPKLFRALDLGYPVEAPEPEAGAPPVEVLRAALAKQYDRLLAHDPGTRLGDDPESLHQLRVATRRARAFLRAARPLLDPDWASELRDELGWLGSTLGPARDLDVLLEHVRGKIESLDVADELIGLVESLEREHEQARRAAVAALSEDRYLALLDRLEDLDRSSLPAPMRRWGSSGGTSSAERAARSRSSTPSRATTSCTPRASRSSARATRQSSPRRTSGDAVSGSWTPRRTSRTSSASTRTPWWPRSA